MYCYLCLLLDLLCDVNVYVFEQSAVSVAQFRGPSLRGLAPVCIYLLLIVMVVLSVDCLDGIRPMCAVFRKFICCLTCIVRFG